MRVLDVQEQVKLIEISKEWAEETANHASPGRKNPIGYPREFDNIYKQLVKTASEVMLEK